MRLSDKIKNVLGLRGVFSSLYAALLQRAGCECHVTFFAVISPYSRLYYTWFAFLTLFTACWLWYSFRQVKRLHAEQ